MIDRLKFLIDEFEDTPKVKELLLAIAQLPEGKQEDALKLVEMILEAKR